MILFRHLFSLFVVSRMRKGEGLSDDLGEKVTVSMHNTLLDVTFLQGIMRSFDSIDMVLRHWLLDSLFNSLRLNFTYIIPNKSKRLVKGRRN